MVEFTLDPSEESRPGGGGIVGTIRVFLTRLVQRLTELVRRLAEWFSGRADAADRGRERGADLEEDLAMISSGMSRIKRSPMREGRG